MNTAMETNKILYVYIDRYKGAKNVEVCLDDRYEIHFDKASSKLSIKESETHIDGFWGKKIYSLATIVGENGSGKTTTIRYILEAVASGYNKIVDDNIVVMKKGGEIRVCTKREIAYECSVKYEIADYLSIPAFHYSAHFELPFNGGEIANSQFGKEYYNATDGYRLVRDLQDYCNYGAMNYDRPFYDHLLGYYAQNAFRICTLLGDHYNELEEFGLRPPLYLQIAPNTSGATFLRSDYRTANITIPPFPELNWSKKECVILAWFMYNIVINIAVDIFRFAGKYNSSDSKPDIKWFSDDINDAVKKWVDVLEGETYSKTDCLIDAFCDYLANSGHKEIFPTNAKEMLSIILQCEFFKRGEDGRFCFNIKRNKAGVKEYLDDLKRTGSYLYIIRFFDIVYSHDPYGETILSSGEQAMLDLYSRIYDALLTSQSPLNNKIGPQLIVLDEAEIGYHPEWQRRFVKNVTQFLNSLNVPDEFFQIVLTSHSPLILSDIPLACTNYLTKKDVPRPRQETFGANIFDLYHNSFFLEEGMIGEFAMGKIENVVSLIDDWKKRGRNVASEKMRAAKQIINLIANERLKDYLMDELSAIDKETAIEYYQQKIDNLKQGKHEQN
ncbi:MAG: ATP-binding protein [Bacteroidales bacterium]|nr:ATP-binding protein [Bacteroidales bacterium]